MSEPSLLKCTAETGSECAGRVFRHFPVRTSQIRTLSSKDPLTCNHIVSDNYQTYLGENHRIKQIQRILITTYH